VNAPLTADTMLDSTAVTSNFGAATELEASGTHAILLRFDTTALGPGTILTVDLHFWTTTSGGLQRGSLQVFRLLEDWTEGTGTGQPGAASWQDRLAGIAWTGPGASGGARDPTPLGSTPATGDATEQVVALSLSAVEGWRAAPATNFGVVLATKDQANRKLVMVAREGQTGRAAFLHVRLAGAALAH
jgi:hypothetical protein